MPPPSDQHDHHNGGYHRGVGAAAHAPPPPKPNQKLLSLILKAIIMTSITALFFLFLGVAAILLLLATAALHRHSTAPSSSSSSSPSSSSAGFSNGLLPKDLKKLPLFRFSKRSNLDDHDDCVVCLDVIRNGQWCRKLLGCGHVFHRKCVDAWLVKVPACPICRTRVWLDGGGGPLHIEDRPLLGFGWRNNELATRVW